MSRLHRRDLLETVGHNHAPRNHAGSSNVGDGLRVGPSGNGLTIASALEPNPREFVGRVGIVAVCMALLLAIVAWWPA